MAREMTVDERVAAGAALLDRRLGPDWRSKVNPHTLRMESNCQCVLGQLWSGEAIKLDMDESPYMLALKRLRIRLSARYGFTLTLAEENAGIARHGLRPYWKELAAAWRRELKRDPTST